MGEPVAASIADGVAIEVAELLESELTVANACSEAHMGTDWEHRLVDGCVRNYELEASCPHNAPTHCIAASRPVSVDGDAQASAGVHAAG